MNRGSADPRGFRGIHLTRPIWVSGWAQGPPLHCMSSIGISSDTVSTRRPRTVSLAVLALLLLVVGCSWRNLPSVSDSVIDRVRGENVRIVAEESDTNPTEEWIYTYLLLEVDAPERHLDVVSETLTRNGWQTRESAAQNIQLVALIPAEADLTLITLDSFLKPIASSPVAAKFADVQRDVDKAYFVAIIMPLEER